VKIILQSCANIQTAIEEILVHIDTPKLKLMPEEPITSHKSTTGNKAEEAPVRYYIKLFERKAVTE